MYGNTDLHWALSLWTRVMDRLPSVKARIPKEKSVKARTVGATNNGPIDEK